MIVGKYGGWLSCVRQTLLCDVLARKIMILLMGLDRLNLVRDGQEAQ